MINLNTLESNITRHCTQRCACCSHASPWAKPYFMRPEQLAKDLAVLKPFVHCRQFFALGGEPLLHPKICEILDVITASGITDQNGVLTNGALLGRMPEEFWQKVKCLRISVYPKLDRAMISLAQSKASQYGFFLGISYIDLFWKQFKRTPDDGRESFAHCPWKGSCLTVHDSHFYLCPNSAFFPDSFMGLPIETDGLPLDENLTEEKFQSFLDRKEPLTTCQICHSYAERNLWHEVNSLEEWKKDATL